MGAINFFCGSFTEDKWFHTNLMSNLSSESMSDMSEEISSTEISGEKCFLQWDWNSWQEKYHLEILIAACLSRINSRALDKAVSH